jgi:hypothetical protein
MHRAPRLLFGALAVSLLAFALPSRASTLLITYDLVTGSASFDPFTVPNPQGGADLTVTPSLTIDSGSFQAAFENGSGIVGLADGPASISGLTFTGTISISIATVIDTGIFPLPVQAVLSGPLTGLQISPSNGSLSILGADSVYTDTSPGNFDVAAGPLACSDSFFGIVCGLLETALGITFPITLPAADNAPIPFAGVFRDLDTPGASTSGNTFDFTVPVGAGADFGASINFSWAESARTVIVPEPSLALFAPLATLALLPRRRRSRPECQERT